MDLLIQYLGIGLGMVFGFAAAQLLRLRTVGKCINELEVGDPQFEGKIEIIRRFMGTGL